MNRRNFINNLLTATAGFTILPGAGRLWKAERKILKPKVWEGPLPGWYDFLTGTPLYKKWKEFVGLKPFLPISELIREPIMTPMNSDEFELDFKIPTLIKTYDLTKL